MKKLKVCSVVMVLLAVQVVALAGSLENMQRWASHVGPEDAAKGIQRRGIKDPEAVAVILEDWDEETVVTKALAEDAIPVLTMVAHHEGLSDDSVERILAHERAKDAPHGNVWHLAMALPGDQRSRFRDLMEKLVPAMYGDRPVQAAMAMKYEVNRGVPFRSPDAETADLVAVLLAEEPLNLYVAERLKVTIKDHAVRLAKRKIREEGLSFVAKDGVNPLTERVRPVVDALNAPACAGLEVALRGLGASLEDHDRSALQALTASWTEEVMLGELPSSRTSAILGRLSIGLGVEGFNTFVEEYNNGTAE